MTKYTVVYTEEAEGGFSGRSLELPGAINHGETLEELKVDIRVNANLHEKMKS